MKKAFASSCLLLALLLVACATVPSVRVSHPWIRALKTNQAISPKGKLNIVISGTTTPLLGDEQLTRDRLQSALIQLITRRGFTIDSASYDYVMKLYYRTDRADKIKCSSEYSLYDTQIFANSALAGTVSSHGLGVNVARAISALSTFSYAKTTQSSEVTSSFTHTIAIELTDTDGELLWKGESTWDTEDLNLLNRIIPTLQLILSDLPKDENFHPEIMEVKASHALNYYRLECEDVWFTCPALPYRIFFAENWGGSSYDFEVLTNIKDKEAFAAYVDLIQTAEFAVPNGTEKEWINPLNLALWEKVTLGGQYYLGPTKMPINIIVRLEGKPDGYYVRECKLVSEEEYKEFQNKLAKWSQILTDFYNVFEN